MTTTLGECPPMHPLNAELLDRYFESFIQTGFLPPRKPTFRRHFAPPSPAGRGQGEGDKVSAALGCKVIKAIRAPGDAVHSIMTELTSWRFKNRSGLFHYGLQMESGRILDVMVKVKPRDSEVIEVGAEIARLCSEELGATY